MLPLRRELFDSADHQISQDLFTQVKFGLASGQATAQAKATSRAQAKAQAQQPAWTTPASAARFRAALAAAGWQVPAALPGGLPLYTAAYTQTGSGKVVDLEYSDGLYVVSLFVQQGQLSPDMPGWQPVTVAGQQAYTAGHSLTWARLGFVYTMITDAPAGTVSKVVGSLPAGDSSGLLGRLGRGLERLARMANPFG
jgi:negative regulator of sigma E activity